MKKITLIIASMILFFVSSCTITQEYKFNDDFSGTTETNIDLSSMINLIKSSDTTGNSDNSFDTLTNTFAGIEEELDNLGAKNINLEWNENHTIITLSYDFDNIDMLNKITNKIDIINLLSLNEEPGKEEKKSKEIQKFTIKGKKKFIYNQPILENDTLFSGENSDAMNKYYKYKLIFSFDNEIKNINNKEAELSKDKKSISFEGNLFDLTNEENKTNFKIKLK